MSYIVDKDYHYKKIDVELKLYDIMHENIRVNDKRAVTQCVQIYVSIAAVLGFVGLVYDDGNKILIMASNFMIIYIVPLMATAAIESVLSVLIRDAYAAIFTIEIENRINQYLSEVSNLSDKMERVLGYENFQFSEGFRKDVTSNFDMYFLGILTMMIGVGIPILWLWFNSIIVTWKVFFFIEIIILICIIVYSLVNLYKTTKKLEEIAISE